MYITSLDETFTEPGIRHSLRNPVSFISNSYLSIIKIPGKFFYTENTERPPSNETSPKNAV